MSQTSSPHLLHRVRRFLARAFGDPAQVNSVGAALRAQHEDDLRWRAKTEHQLSVVIEHQKKILKEVRMHRREEARWRWRFRQQLDAQMRQHAVSATGLMSPHWLEGQRFRLRSQNEEDGILLALFRSTGTPTRRFVEIGSGKKGGNSAILAFEFGWAGLMVDAGSGKIDVLRRVIAHNPGVVAVESFVTPENFNALLEAHGFTGEVDMMSIDIDSFDYWLLDSLRVCSPRILIMEYNAGFGPDRAVTLPSPLPEGPFPDGYSGASLAAMVKCARRKGYGLVLCEPNGINAFFLRDDVAPEVPRLTPADAFRRPVRKLVEDDEDEGAPVEDLYSIIESRGLPLVEV